MDRACRVAGTARSRTARFGPLSDRQPVTIPVLVLVLVPSAVTIPVPVAPARHDPGPGPVSRPPSLTGPWHAEAVCRRDEAGLFFAPSKEPTAARLAR
ncbi:hypothetical protein ACWD4I_38525, partial [Streptomyces sp. NPDC002535]